MPNEVNDYRLTYHLGGLHPLFNETDYLKLNEEIKRSFEVAKKYKMEDVSIHPPFGTNLDQALKDQSKQYLHKLLNQWIPAFKKENITLSIETHVTKDYFIFNGLYDFADYVSKIDDLGILIDLSHNYYDNYKEEEIISLFQTLNVTGLHISDANNELEFEKGTHLPLPKGKINFKPIIDTFKDKDIYGVFEVKSSSDDLKVSVDIIKSYIT